MKKMPVINVDKKDFCKLVGKDIPMQEIEERLPMLGVAWEGKEEDSFDVEVSSNRPDMLSVEGLARAFSTFMNIRTGLKNYKTEQSEYLVKVDDKVKKVRPFFVSCVIRNIHFSDDFIKSIMQIQEKLHITHCRKRKKVAIGIHDLDKIHFPVIYTTKKPGFKFIPLEQKEQMSMEEILKELPKGRDYAWILKGMEEYPLLHDSKETVLSMPPIINSEDTKIQENTKNVFVDITATDEKAANEVLNIIAATFADRGAKLFKVKIKYPDRLIETPDLTMRNMNLELDYVNKLLGLNLKNYEVIEYLQRMGFDAIEVGKNIQVVIPCYRTDIMHSMDLVEDVAIAYGYENFEPEIPKISTIGEEDLLEVFSTKLRNLMVGYGLQEVMTFILTSKDNLFKKMNLKEKEVAETSNAKTKEYSVLRNWLLPSLMEVLSRNKHHEYPQNLFEVGDVIVVDPSDDTGAKTKRRLALALCHSKANFSEMKSLVESVLNNVGVKDFKVQESTCPCYIPGRGGKILVNGKALARFVEFHPSFIEKWELETPVTGGEIYVELLFDLMKGK